MKWKVFSGYSSGLYRDWEDEAMARLGLKNVLYLLQDPAYATAEPPTQAEASADDAKMQLLKDYNLAMSILFNMTSDHPRKIVRRATVPQKALKNLREKYLEGKSDDDFVEVLKLWEGLKPIGKEADPDVLLDLMLEINERMEDIHADLKRSPIEVYAKYRMLLHQDYESCIQNFNLARAPGIYRPINQKELDEFSRTIQNHWKTHFKREDANIVDQSAIYNLSNGSNKCDYCGKNNHNAFKDGKPFCFKLIKDIKAGNSSKGDKSPSTKTRLFCKYCKSKDHDVDECPKLAKKETMLIRD